MRSAVPVFYGRFACKAGDCVHSCCRGWEIDVDEDSAARYRSEEGPLGEELRAALRETEEGFSFRLTADERCPFLRRDGLCRLILALGEEALCDICALHPRFFEEVGGFELYGLGLSCERVCELLLESGEPLRFFVEDEGRPLDFAQLLGLLGIGTGETELRFRPAPSRTRYAAILRAMAATEPIDDARGEGLRALQTCLEDLVENAEDYAAVYDAPRYDRVFQYLLFRQLERTDQRGLALLAGYAGLGTEFIFMQDALLGPDAEHLRRFSEQIEYSTENVDRLLDQAASSPALS